MTETAEQAAIGSGVSSLRGEAARPVPMGFFRLASGVKVSRTAVLAFHGPLRTGVFNSYSDNDRMSIRKQ